MDIKTNFNKHLFKPLFGIFLINIVLLVIGILFIVFRISLVKIVAIYAILLPLINVTSLLYILFCPYKNLLDDLVNKISSILEDFTNFYNANVNGFTNWSQVLIDSPDELVSLSRYFHNNIANIIYEFNIVLDHDNLTGLKTRIRLIGDLEENPNHALAILNINNFKEVNSFYGVRIADNILCAVSNMLEDYFTNENYLLYRVHGDQFAVLWTNCTDINIFASKLNGFLDFLEKKEISTDKYTYLNIGVTIGIASSYDSAKYSMVNAMMALHHAKQYKTSMVVYNKNLPILSLFKDNIHYTEVIYRAIKNDTIYPFFQKIESINENDETLKYEVLMRIIDQDEQIIAPNLFLGISKRSSAYSKLSRIVIEKSFKYLFDRKNYVFSVNLSIEDINSTGFLEWFIDRVTHYKLESRVIIEITEQETVEDFESVNNFITCVKELGIKVALDDFGSGYSNFVILMKLQIDYLKIDGSLIRNIDKDVSAQLIVETIIRFAKLLKMQVIAEFVCSKKIYDTVKNMGVDYVQGSYVSIPCKDI